MARGCRNIDFMQIIPRFTNAKLWEDGPERTHLLLFLKLLILFSKTVDPLGSKTFGP